MSGETRKAGVGSPKGGCKPPLENLPPPAKGGGQGDGPPLRGRRARYPSTGSRIAGARFFSSDVVHRATRIALPALTLRQVAERRVVEDARDRLAHVHPEAPHDA